MSQGFGLDQLGQREDLAFGKDPWATRKILEREVASIGWEGDDRVIGVDRACGGFEFSEEELIERFEITHRIEELGFLELESVDKRADPLLAGGLVHEPPVDPREDGALDERVERETSEGIAVGPTEEAFAIDRFLLDLASVTIVEFDSGQVQAIVWVWSGLDSRFRGWILGGDGGVVQGQFRIGLESFGFRVGEDFAAGGDTPGEERRCALVRPKPQRRRMRRPRPAMSGRIGALGREAS